MMSEKNTEWFKQHTNCCACGNGMQESPHVNLVQLEELAEWPYPTVGNVLTGESGHAVAVVCNACLDLGAEIRNAIEFADGEDKESIIYHTIDGLELRA